MSLDLKLVFLKHLLGSVVMIFEDFYYGLISSFRNPLSIALHLMLRNP